MVGPKKKDFWPRINILEEKKNLSMNVASSKIGPDLSNKVVQKLTLKKYRAATAGKALDFGFHYPLIRNNPSKRFGIEYWALKNVDSWPKIMLFRTHHL